MKITYILPHSPEACGWVDKDFATFNHFSHAYRRVMEEFGHETELLYLGKDKEIRKFGHNTIQFPNSFGKEFGKEFSLSLIQYIRKLDTDIVHILGYLQYNMIPLLFILFMKKTPVVIHNRGSAANYSKFKVRIYYKVLALLFKVTLLFKVIDIILSVNATEIENFKKAGLQENKIRYSPPGIDTSILFPEQKEEARKKLNLSQEKKYLLFVGGLIKRKGVDYLIKSISLIRNKYPDIALLIVGGGAELQNFKKFSEKLGISGRVKFFGFVNEAKNLRTYYNAADICVFPSLSEGFGRTPIEALACKKPVIGTKKHIQGGVLKHGKNALLAELRSSESLAENISILLDNPELADKLSSNGYNYVINNVDWKKIGEKLNDIYAEIKSK